MPSSFTQEDLKSFSLYEFVKQVTPGAGPFFLPQGYNVNNLGKVLLDKIKYQMSKA